MMGLVGLLVLVGMAGAFTINATYGGNGTFMIRDKTWGDVAEVKGNGNMEMGITAGKGVSWNGFNFSGTGGKFRMFGESGPLHSVLIYNASTIAAQMQIDDNESWVELSGSGIFEEEAYETGKNGQPEKVLSVEFEGEIVMDTTIFNEPEPPKTTDITEADK